MKMISTGSGLQFPRSFLWGTATAAHQVEGNNANNDWWRWEQVPGHVADGTRSGLACDHYHRFREDFDLLSSLRQNAHRLSIEWSRIEPSPGQIDREAVAHYREVLECLRERGIEPIVTLHHFTNPIWLAERGGWEDESVVEPFLRFVRLALREYGDLVRCWVTINEPVVYTYMGYIKGTWPPGRRSARLALRVMRNMVRAHGRAYQVIHEESPRSDVQVGVAHHLRIFDPYRPRLPLDRWVAALPEYLFNRCLLMTLIDGKLRVPLGHGQIMPEAVGSTDFLGLNYYTRDTVGFQPKQLRMLFGGAFPTQGERSLPGWEIYPEGMYRLLKFLAPLGKPIYITENGVADERDELRPYFLVRHLAQIHRAIQEGAPVQGYMHWSSMDNFEWADGLRLRFGLVHVDFETQKRTVKPSGWLYADICGKGGITAKQLDRYAPEVVRRRGAVPGLAAGQGGAISTKSGA